MRWWLRSLAIGAAVGLGVGVVVGGTLGRVFMRIVFLAQDDALGLETAMGAIIGEFTGGGTAAIYVFGGFAGVSLGIAYTVGRTLLPSGRACGRSCSRSARPRSCSERSSVTTARTSCSCR